MYLVAYTHTSGFGNIEIGIDHPINSLADVREIEQIIVSHGVASPIILNWMLMAGPEAVNAKG
jgi:hypothetical protein